MSDAKKRSSRAPARNRTSVDPSGKASGKANGKASGKAAGASTRASARTKASARTTKNRRKASARRRRSSRWTWAGRALVSAFFLASVGLLGAVGMLSYYGRDLPTVETMERYDPPQVTLVVDRRGRAISEMFEERRTVVPMAKIPRVLVLSVLAAEDADFYRHRGLDYAGILRALVRDVVSGRRMQGASTITQQIIKNVMLSSERSIARKVKELILARRLEQELSKDEILHLYLNHIYFGHGRYGVQEASRFFFGKDVDKLDLAEAATLAGIPQSPARLSPLRHPEASKRRRDYVLDQLEGKRAQYWPDLSAEAIAAARKGTPKLHGKATPDGGAPEVATVAKRMLEAQVGEEGARHGGYRIETTIDLDLQEAARRALQEGLKAIDERNGFRAPLKAPQDDKKGGKKGGKRGNKRRDRPKRVATLAIGPTYDAVVTGTGDGEVELDVGGHRALAAISDVARHNPKNLPAKRFAEVGAQVRVSVQRLAQGKQPARVRLELGPQGAVVVIDPRTRDVLALVGGDEAVYGFNRALSAVRQPGSTFKPITYALAIESQQYTPATLVLDAPEVFDKWKPGNYETWNYQGAVRLREAVARSINLVAVRVMSDLTPERVASFAKELGIESKLDPSLALALGASGVRPIELVNAYATFAAGGRWAPYRLVRSMRDAGGRPVALPKPERTRDVVSPASAYVLTSMLESVVQSGTAKAARKLGRPAAGKTGTSNQARDAWFVGYTPEVVVGVWVGFDDHRPLGKRESGGTSALPIWMDVVRAAVGKARPVEFPVPGGVERARIDPDSGLLAYEGMEGAIDEVFVAGTAPTELAAAPDQLDTNSFLMEQLTGGDTGASPRAPE